MNILCVCVCVCVCVCLRERERDRKSARERKYTRPKKVKAIWTNTFFIQFFVHYMNTVNP